MLSCLLARGPETDHTTPEMCYYGGGHAVALRQLPPGMNTGFWRDAGISPCLSLGWYFSCHQTDRQVNDANEWYERPARRTPTLYPKKRRFIHCLSTEIVPGEKRKRKQYERKKEGQGGTPDGGELDLNGIGT